MGRAHEVRAASMAKTAAKKSAANGRAAKEIYMIAKQGGTDPNANLALRAAIDKAKSNSVPVDVINRAIKRVEGGDAESYTENRYEGYGPGKVAMIIDALTSNVNRAIANIREVMNKGGGNLGSSVGFLFTNLGTLMFEGTDADEIMMGLLDKVFEPENVVEDDGVITVTVPFTAFAAAKQALDELGINDYLKAETGMVPNDTVTIDDEETKAKFQRLLDKLDELDDVQAVYHNAKDFD